MKGWKKGMAAALAAVFTVGTAAGCAASMSEYAETPALVYGEETVYLDEANFWLRYQQWVMESQYGLMYQYYGYENMWEAPADEYTTLGQQLKEDVMAQLIQTCILNDHAEEMGVSLTEEDQTRITETIADFRETFDASFAEYSDASDESITAWMQKNATAVKVWDAVKQDTEVTVSDEESQMFTVEYVTITESSDTSESTEAASTEADSTAAEDTEAASADAESTETTAAESTEASGEESTAAESTEASGEETTAAEETTSAEESLTGEALADEAVRRLQEGQSFADFEDELGLTSSSQSFLISDTENESTIYQNAVDMATGDVKKVAYDGGWYVIYCVSDLDEEATEEQRAQVEDEKREEYFNTVYAEWTEAAPEYEVQDGWDDLKVNQMIYVAKETTAAETTGEDSTGEETTAAETTGEETAGAETTGETETGSADAAGAESSGTAAGDTEAETTAGEETAAEASAEESTAAE